MLMFVIYLLLIIVICEKQLPHFRQAIVHVQGAALVDVSTEEQQKYFSLRPVAAFL